MDVRTALKTGIAKLREAGVPSFTLSTELLLLHVATRDRTWLYAHPEENLPPEITDRFFALIARRAAGEPTQYLTGKQEFWGLEFEVTPDVLIPRPETEHVIEVALDRLALREVRAGRPQQTIGEGLYIADVGTGSGCIAIALAKELPKAEFVATDISRAALEVAGRNAVRHGVGERIRFVQGDLLERSGEEQMTSGERAAPLLFDLVASNPPYIGRREAPTLAREVREHEPAHALFGGEEGYEMYGDLISQSAASLNRGGILVLELGHDSLPAVQPLLDASNWTRVGVTKDLAGIPRVISAEKT
jgi:release factor glutamine methyltransferase